MDVLLISESELKNLTPISKNVDITTYLLQSITTAQLLYIKPLICKDIWTELQVQALDFVNNQIPLTALYQELLDQIKPCLAYYTLYQMLPFIHVKIREIGLIVQTSENSIPADKSDMQSLYQSSLQSAEAFQILLLTWYNENEKLFGFTNCGCSEETNKMTTTSSWFMTV
jgi:hypothetical protein